MPKSSRPRKAYRPRPVGRPVLDKMRNDLVLPCYSALEVLIKSDNAEALESARHTLCALYDYMLAALNNDGRDASMMSAALDAIVSMDMRYKARGVYRPSGQELARLRAAVIHADQTLPMLSTDKVAIACLQVDRALAGVA